MVVPTAHLPASKWLFLILNVNKKLTSFWGAKALFKKTEFEQKVRVFNGKNLIRKIKIYDNFFANFEKCEKL